MSRSVPCTRFEEEGALKVELGEPLDDHFSNCSACVEARRKYDRVADLLAKTSRLERAPESWQTRVLEKVDKMGHHSTSSVRFSSASKEVSPKPSSPAPSTSVAPFGGSLRGGSASAASDNERRTGLPVSDDGALVEGSGNASLVRHLSSARFGAALGDSLPMRALFARLESVSRTNVPVLLVGEAGTETDLLARGIHDASQRAKGPFVAFPGSFVSIERITKAIVELMKLPSAGAKIDWRVRLCEANGGTLFVDEIDKLPIDVQTKFLRALESRTIKQIGDTESQPIDARIVAATSRDLHSHAASGGFRADLFDRLGAVTIQVPPLRERKDDIPLLVERFLHESVPPLTLSDLPSTAMALLQEYDWPGNVRELRNAVARFSVFGEDIRELRSAVVRHQSLTQTHLAMLREWALNSDSSSKGKPHAPFRDVAMAEAARPDEQGFGARKH